MRLNAGGLSEIVIGRVEEIKSLSAYIKLQQHTAIIAPRRYGKTTLVKHVLSTLDKDKHLIIQIDVMSASSIRELCTQLIDAVYASHGVANFFKQVKDNVIDFMSKLNLDSEYVSIGYDILREEDETEMLKKAFNLPELFAQKYQKKSVVFIDEFGEIGRFGQDVIKKMRSYFQQHAQTTYIFAGSQTSTMKQIFLHKENAFFNFASIMPLGTLKTEPVKHFLEELDLEGISLDKDAISELIHISQNHPFYVIKLLQESYILCLINKTQLIDVSVVQAALHKILKDNEALFIFEWDKINSKKHKGRILKELAGATVIDHTPINASYKSQMIRELKDDAILHEDKSFTDPLFSNWLQHN